MIPSPSRLFDIALRLFACNDEISDHAGSELRNRFRFLTPKNDLQSNELDLQALSQEDSFLISGPFDVIVSHLHLQISGGRGEVIDKCSY